VPITTHPPSPLRPNLLADWMLRPGLTFLNHGSFGSLPRAILDAQNQWRLRIESDPIELLGRRRPQLVDAAKIPVAKRFGMKPENFGFVTNATEAVNAVLRSLNLRPGDELLTTDHVYHAVRQTMKLAARNTGATCREVPIPLPVASAKQIADLVTGAISPKTKLLVIDHVTSPSGLVFPIPEIVAACNRLGVDTLVDGAHVPGMLPLDVESIGATYYAANLHKWVCAAKGTAFLWVAPSHQNHVHPAVVSHHLDEGFSAEFGWQGTRDLTAWLTAPAAIAFMESLGWDAVLNHNHQMATWAHQMLTGRWGVEPVSPPDGSLLGSTASVRLPGKFAKYDGNQLLALQQHLHDHHNIEVPMIPWPGHAMLRVSCQVYNRPEDYEKLADAIAGL
jgi:isopenicillin-N epimerase